MQGGNFGLKRRSAFLNAMKLREVSFQNGIGRIGQLKDKSIERLGKFILRDRGEGTGRRLVEMMGTNPYVTLVYKTMVKGSAAVPADKYFRQCGRMNLLRMAKLRTALRQQALGVCKGVPAYDGFMCHLLVILLGLTVVEGAPVGKHF